METVLITGGAGFIGGHLCKRLLEDGYAVICVDNFASSDSDKIKDLELLPNFRFIEHDVTKPLPESISAQYVFHLASPASPNHHSPISYLALPFETMMVNTIGTRELLSFAERNNAKFLFSSTSEIYGDPQVHPQNEDYRGNVSTIGPRAVYDESKRFGETITSYFWRERNVDARIARIFNTYGPGMLTQDMRMIVRFITQALNGEPMTIFGDGLQTRSLCYISDTVDGLIRLMFYPNTNKEVINIGSGDEHTVLEFAKIVKELANSTSEITFAEKLPADDPTRRRADISKAKSLLDWEPQVPLRDGLKMMIEELRNN